MGCVLFGWIVESGEWRVVVLSENFEHYSSKMTPSLRVRDQFLTMKREKFIRCP